MESPFKDIVKQLTGDQTPRVWSLLMTVFGELAQEDGSAISGALLSRLTTLMGMKPEAMRVALHRLRKDGWIKSKRSGRTSSYSLTDWGRAQSVEATPLIYSINPIPMQAWLVTFDPSQPTADGDNSGVWISSNLLLTSSDEIYPDSIRSLVSPDTSLPDWLKEKACDIDMIENVQNLHQRLVRLQDSFLGLETMDCFEISVARILIVDGWRRIALRTPYLPDYVFPADWLGKSCRTRVITLLDLLKKQDLTTLEATL